MHASSACAMDRRHPRAAPRVADARPQRDASSPPRSPPTRRARPTPSAPAAAPATRAEREARAAFWLTLDAINFGSGWFPTLRKRAGLLGLQHGRGRPARPVRDGALERAAQLAELDAADDRRRRSARTPATS